VWANFAYGADCGPEAGFSCYARFNVSSSIELCLAPAACVVEGARIEEILLDFPTLTEEDVRAVIAFATVSAEEDLPLHGAPMIP
jgi:hypothetical protein